MSVKNLLVVMSDDPTSASLAPLLSDPLAGRFNIVAGLEAVERKPDITGRSKLFSRAGFEEDAFNRLSPDTRVAMTRTFLRDMTVLARESDGLVITGSSNVGRLMALLFGNDKADAGGLHSADVRWFPTTRYS